jgi:hypothetical protein
LFDILCVRFNSCWQIVEHKGRESGNRSFGVVTREQRVELGFGGVGKTAWLMLRCNNKPSVNGLGGSCTLVGDSEMLFSALVSLLIGVVLARHFKVLILAPAFMLTLILAISTGLAHTAAFWSIGSTALVIIVGLQVGYLLGSGMRHVMVFVRAGRPRSASFTSSLPPHRPAH